MPREPQAKPYHTAWGFLRLRERWGLTARGWLAAVGVLGCVSFVGLLKCHPFLSVTRRVEASTLVIEGWIHPYAIETGVREFRSGMYDRIVVTGGPVSGIGDYRNDFQTTASVGVDNLRANGVPPHLLHAAPARAAARDRTFAAAVALGSWLKREQPTVTRINVLTEDCHGRRTRLLYRRALGSSFDVGIISVKNPDYNPRRWWRYSEGVREVLGEFTAYIYARFFFWPGDADRLLDSASSSLK